MTIGTEERVRRLLTIGQELVAELDPEEVLQRILEEAKALTGARYAAVGILNEARTELERFVTSGLAPEAHRAIGDLPHGRGVLGVLIEDPRPLRLHKVSDHPQSYGFPPSHPRMESFLGVPIAIRGQAWGNLYLADKAGGQEFTASDEEAVGILANWAGTAVENARLYEHSEHRREQLERAVLSLEASRDIVHAIGGVAELDQVLALIAKRGRALVQARAILIMLREADELVVAAAAGHAVDAKGQRLPVDASSSGSVLRAARPVRVDDASAGMQIAPDQLGVPGARTALLVPMLHRGGAIGVLAAFDRGPAREPFSVEDEELLRGFAASAANAVAIKRSVAAERLRGAIQAGEAERRRWARELHDETLQALGALRVLLASADRRGDEESYRAAVRRAVEDIEVEIGNLRAIIADLRPSLLDDIGLQAALDALIERRREQGLDIESTVVLPESTDGNGALPPDLETAVYRLVQEALTNVVKHAEARSARILIAHDADELVVEVQDDGRGFDPEARVNGFGLAGMRERVYLAGGTVELSSGSQGTLVRVRLPVRGG